MSDCIHCDRYLIKLYDGRKRLGTAYAPRDLIPGEMVRFRDRYFQAIGTRAADWTEPTLLPVLDLTAEEDG